MVYNLYSASKRKYFSTEQFKSFMKTDRISIGILFLDYPVKALRSVLGLARTDFQRFLVAVTGLYCLAQILFKNEEDSKFMGELYRRQTD